jgi:hypothetical protein
MNRLSKRFGTALLLALAASVIGAVFSSTHDVDAAQQAVPSPQTPPTISGNPVRGSTLTANPGTWNGTQPITFAYQWRRCARNGGSCSNIGGAVSQTYVLRSVDVGNTLRVRVTARNADGSRTETSVPTAVIRPPATPPPPAPTGCPTGTGTINVGDLSPPARLNLDSYQATPSVIGRPTGELAVRFHVSACGGRSVQGALVYVTAVPFAQFSIPPETPTGSDGWAAMSMSQLRGFPAARRQQLLVLFGRARKSGDNLLGGVSTRRLVSLRVDLSR